MLYKRTCPRFSGERPGCDGHEFTLEVMEQHTMDAVHLPFPLGDILTARPQRYDNTHGTRLLAVRQRHDKLQREAIPLIRKANRRHPQLGELPGNLGLRCRPMDVCAFRRSCQPTGFLHRDVPFPPESPRHNRLSQEVEHHWRDMKSHLSLGVANAPGCNCR